MQTCKSESSIQKEKERQLRDWQTSFLPMHCKIFLREQRWTYHQWQHYVESSDIIANREISQQTPRIVSSFPNHQVTLNGEQFFDMIVVLVIKKKYCKIFLREQRWTYHQWQHYVESSDIIANREISQQTPRIVSSFPNHQVTLNGEQFFDMIVVLAIKKKYLCFIYNKLWNF